MLVRLSAKHDDEVSPQSENAGRRADRGPFHEQQAAQASAEDSCQVSERNSRSRIVHFDQTAQHKEAAHIPDQMHDIAVEIRRAQESPPFALPGRRFHEAGQTDRRQDAGYRELNRRHDDDAGN